MSSRRKNATFVTRFLDESGAFGVEIYLKRGTAGAPDYLTYVPRRYWSHPSQTDAKQSTDELVLGCWSQLAPLAHRGEAFIKKHVHNPRGALEAIAKEQCGDQLAA